MNKQKVALIAVVLVCTTYLLSSCKQGCTDSKAFNYNSGAQQDDGSCMYCDSALETLSIGQTYIYDGDAGSPYQFSYVLAIEDRYSKANFTGNGCRALGIQGDQNCVQGRNYVTLHNLVSSNIRFSCDLTVSISSSFGFTSTNNYPISTVIIPAGDSLALGNVGANCLDQGTFFSVSITSTNYSLQYQ